MRIGFSGFVMDGGRSGISTYVHSLLKELHEIDRKNDYDLYVAHHDHPFLPKVDENFHTKVYPDLIGNPIINILWHNVFLPFVGRKYDLFHIPSIRRVPIVKTTKIVATVHDLAPIILKGKYDRLRTFYHENILTRAIHTCDAIITVSRSTKEDILRLTNYPSDKIEVIYPGINPAYKPSPNEKVAKENLQLKYGIHKPFFLYVSRLEHPGKNHLRLIEAFKTVNLSKEYQLILVGAPWRGAEKIEEAAKGVEDVRLLGFVPTNDLRDLYSTCSLMIFPSLYEGFGLPIIEAMACGAEVACSNTSSMKEIGEKHAALFNPLSIEEMARVMRHPPQSPNKERIRYGQSFQWKKTAEATLSVYRSI